MARQFCSEKTIEIKNAYNCELIFITKNDDAAATAVGVAYLSFSNLLTNHKGALYTQHSIIYACPKSLNICNSSPGNCKNDYFEEFASSGYQTMKYRTGDISGLCICDCGEHIKQYRAFC